MANYDHLTARLKSFKQEVDAISANTDELRNLLAIKLIDFIKGNSALKLIFDKRLYYFDNLLKNVQFLVLEENLIKSAAKLAGYFDLRLVKDNHKLEVSAVNIFDRKSKEGLTLGEAHLIFSNESKYYHLADSPDLPSSTHGEDYTFFHVEYLLSQYDYFQAFQNILVETCKGKGERLQVKTADYNSYNDNFSSYRNYIQRMPISLDVSSFEKYIIWICSVTPQGGFEGYTRIFKPDSNAARSKHIRLIKDFVSKVISQLINELEDLRSKQPSAFIPKSVDEQIKWNKYQEEERKKKQEQLNRLRRTSLEADRVLMKTQIQEKPMVEKRRVEAQHINKRLGSALQLTEDQAKCTVIIESEKNRIMLEAQDHVYELGRIKHYNNKTVLAKFVGSLSKRNEKEFTKKEIARISGLRYQQITSVISDLLRKTKLDKDFFDEKIIKRGQSKMYIYCEFQRK